MKPALALHWSTVITLTVPKSAQNSQKFGPFNARVKRQSVSICQNHQEFPGRFTGLLKTTIPSIHSQKSELK